MYRYDERMVAITASLFGGHQSSPGKKKTQRQASKDFAGLEKVYCTDQGRCTSN